MAALILKQFDTYPPVVATLTDTNGPINLTTATTVKFIMKSATLLVTGNCTITTPASGVVTYTWGATDTNIAGNYTVEFEIHWAAGGIQTVPNAASANLVIEIDPDLEGA